MCAGIYYLSSAFLPIIIAIGIAVVVSVDVALEWNLKFLQRCGLDLRLRLRLVAVAVEIFDRIADPG